MVFIPIWPAAQCSSVIHLLTEFTLLYNFYFYVATERSLCYRKNWHLCNGSTTFPCSLQERCNWHVRHMYSSESLRGETLKSYSNPETLKEACKPGQQPKLATLPCSPCQKAYCCCPLLPYLQPMPPQKTYTPPHKNLIFLISFPCWAQVCNISTKAVVFLLFEHGGNDWITSSTQYPSSSQWYPGLLNIKENTYHWKG